MTILKGMATAFAGLAMIAAPIAASAANPAASLSLSPSVRAGTATPGKSKLGASVPTTTLISIGILAALVAIVLVATDKSDNSDSK